MGIYINIQNSSIPCLVPCGCVEFGLSITSQSQGDEPVPDYCHECDNSGWIKGSKQWMEDISVRDEVYELVQQFLDPEYGATGTIEVQQIPSVKTWTEAARGKMQDEYEATYGGIIHWPLACWMSYNKLDKFVKMLEIALEKKRTLGMG